MTLFGYLFDSNFKDQRERDKQRGEARDEVSSDPFEDAKTVRRLREDMSRLMVLNRALITLLINSEVITLAELTELSKEIDLLEENKSNDDLDLEMCRDCGRHSYRARANCVYCGALQL
jgi:hypothetical protein